MFFKKLKIELPYDLAVPLLGIYPEKNSNLTRHMHPVFRAALFTILKIRKQPKHLLTDDTVTSYICISKLFGVRKLEVLDKNILFVSVNG